MFVPLRSGPSPSWAGELIGREDVRKREPTDAAEPGPITGDPDTYPEGIENVSMLLTRGE